jgi:hypothetical protein
MVRKTRKTWIFLVLSLGLLLVCVSLSGHVIGFDMATLVRNQLLSTIANTSQVDDVANPVRPFKGVSVRPEDILVVSVMIPGPMLNLEMATLAVGNHQRYCRENGYTYKLLTTEARSERVVQKEAIKKPWQKVPFVADLLREGHPYVYYMDADSVFTNFSAKLERFVALDKDFVFTGDFNSILNSGHFFLRNSNWTLDMLDAVWFQTEFCNKEEAWFEQAQWLWWMAKGDCSLTVDERRARGGWGDGSTCDAYINRTMPHLSPHVACVQQTEMNAYYPMNSFDDIQKQFKPLQPLSARSTCFQRPWQDNYGTDSCYTNHSLWQPGRPVFHAAGAGSADRKVFVLTAIMHQQEAFELAEAPRMLPKLVHHVMPRDFTKPQNPWPNPIREGSYQSWLKHFPVPEFEHRIWTDEELWVLMNHTFPHLAGDFHSRDLNFKRNLICALLLYMYGGIYADVTYEPLTNFYAFIPHSRVSMVESPCGSPIRTHCSLIASPPYLLFWLHYLAYIRTTSATSEAAFGTSVFVGHWAEDLLGVALKRDPVHMLQCKVYQYKP